MDKACLLQIVLLARNGFALKTDLVHSDSELTEHRHQPDRGDTKQAKFSQLGLGLGSRVESEKNQ